MIERHISMRGEVIDFNKLRLHNAEKIALGNANMNAKGDIIGRGGTILKTQEQIDAEWEARTAERRDSASAVDIKNRDAVKAAAAPNSTTAQVQSPPGLATKTVDVADVGFEPAAEPTRRRMIESDK